MIATFAIRASGSRSSRFEQQYRAGEVELELVPQGTLIERIRAGGAGLGGVLTRTAVGTIVAEGKQIVELDGEAWLLERPLRADVALLKAARADTLGNLEYRLAGPNFNPVNGDRRRPRDRRGRGDRRSRSDRPGACRNARRVRRSDRRL